MQTFRNAVVALLTCVPSVVVGSHSMVPDDPSLMRGDTFHLVFVTASGRDALSAIIDDYNSYVQLEAEHSGSLTEGLAIDWFAVASTPLVAANTNAPVSGPVYRLDGTRIANDADDFWDGTIASPISIDQFGREHSGGIVWTGSTANGQPFPEEELGTAKGIAHVGVTEMPKFDVLSHWISSGGARSEEQLRFYALSEPIIVPSPRPGDFNADHKVDSQDVNLLATEISHGTNQHGFDLNMDESVNRADLGIILGGNLIDGGNKLNGDANFDGTVSFADFLILSFYFGLKSRTWTEGDFDANGDIEFTDFLVLSSNFGKASAAMAAVPEPISAYTIPVIGIFLILVRHGEARKFP